jgi:hypothetical protein
MDAFGAKANGNGMQKFDHFKREQDEFIAIMKGQEIE